MPAFDFFTKEQIDQIELKVSAAEQNTSAELVCAVATESGRYDRAESFWGVIFALLALGIAHVLKNGFVIEALTWSEGESAALGWQALAVALGFAVGSVAASYIHPMRRLLVGMHEIEHETQRAALQVFALRQINTCATSGVLIYVSLFERRVVVIASPAVMKAIGDEKLHHLRDMAVERLKQNKRVETFTETLEEASKLLAEALPPEKEDRDTLENHVGIFHPRP